MFSTPNRIEFSESIYRPIYPSRNRPSHTIITADVGMVWPPTAMTVTVCDIMSTTQCRVIHVPDATTLAYTCAFYTPVNVQTAYWFIQASAVCGLRSVQDIVSYIFSFNQQTSETRYLQNCTIFSASD